MPGSSSNLIDRNGVLNGEIAFEREVDCPSPCVQELESKLERRDETIRELRRTVLLELLSLQTAGVSNDANRVEIQKKTIERLRQDEELIIKYRQKADILRVEAERLQVIVTSQRVKTEAEKMALMNSINELEFSNMELNEHVKVVDSDMKYQNIIMLGKDAIIEKQYEQLQEKDAQIEALLSREAATDANNSTLSESNRLLREEIDDLQQNKERKLLLKRLENNEQENLSLKKSLAEYKAGYTTLSRKCATLSNDLAKVEKCRENIQNNRRSSKSVIPGALESVAENRGDHLTDACRQGLSSDVPSAGPTVSRSGTRRSSSHVVRRKSSIAATVQPVTRENQDLVLETENNLTRIQLRRLRGNSVMQVAAKETEEKECQVNMYSSQYANMRLGGDEEVVVKALRRRVAELEEAARTPPQQSSSCDVQEPQDAGQTARRKQAPISSSNPEDDMWREYQTQSYEEFLSLKADVKKQQERIDHLNITLERREEILALRIEPAMQSKAVQCGAEYVVESVITVDRSIQAVGEVKEFSTQTPQHTPTWNHQTIEQPFYSHVFKELIGVCKHVMTSYRTSPQQNDVGEDEASLIITGCKILVSSLGVLRKELCQEMKYRGGEFNTSRSRSLLRCIEIIIRAFDKIIYNNIPINVEEEEAADDNDAGTLDEPCTPMSPVTLHMARCQHEPNLLHNLHYSNNKVLFSCIEKPAVHPADFGGGAAPGALAKPNGFTHHATKHRETRETTFFSDTDCAVSRLGDGFDEFFEAPTPPGLIQAGAISPSSIRATEGTLAMQMSITPVKFSPSTPRRIKKTPQRPQKKGSSGEFFSISRPLSAQRDKSKPSPRHVVLIEAHPK